MSENPTLPRGGTGTETPGGPREPEEGTGGYSPATRCAHCLGYREAVGPVCRGNASTGNHFFVPDWDGNGGKTGPTSTRNDEIPPGWFRTPGRGISPGEAVLFDAVRTLLFGIGEDPDRDGLRDTPKRVVKALREMTAGLWEHPKEILATQFEAVHDELIVLTDIPFTSLCEHHLLPFSGTAAVGYIPKLDGDGRGKVVGLSKLARLVQCFARRPQIQESMTGQIADTVLTALDPVGSACVIRAEHSCLSCRGARLSGAKFVTSALRGALKEDARARAEFFNLAGVK